MKLYQHRIVEEGGEFGYESAILTTVEEAPKRAFGVDYWMNGWILQIPIPIWNFIPAYEDVSAPIRNANVEGWMFPCFGARESPEGKRWFFWWRKWRVKYTSVMPDIPRA